MSKVAKYIWDSLILKVVYWSIIFFNQGAEFQLYSW